MTAVHQCTVVMRPKATALAIVLKFLLVPRWIIISANLSESEGWTSSSLAMRVGWLMQV